MLAPHLGDAVKAPPKKKLWRPAQLGQVWTAKKGAISVKLRNGQDVDPAHLSPSAGFFGSAANMFRQEAVGAGGAAVRSQSLRTMWGANRDGDRRALRAKDADVRRVAGRRGRGARVLVPHSTVLEDTSAPAVLLGAGALCGLGCVEMQKVLDAALFEPGAYATPDAADAWFAPAPEKRTTPRRRRRRQRRSSRRRSASS